MNTTARTILAALTTTGSIAVGIIGGRAAQPTDEESDAVAATASTIVVDGPSLVTEDSVVEIEIPIVGPVFVGNDPAILDVLLATPPAVPENAAGGAEYDGTGSEIIGSVTQQIVVAQDDAADDGFEGQQIHVQELPYVFDEIAAQYVRFPVHAFDICAGRRRGTARVIGSGRGCPVGFAGTLNARFNWPAPFIRGELGHHVTAGGGISQTCPASPLRADLSQTPVTAFSSIPLTGLRAEWRPYRSSRTWTSIDIAGTSAEHTAHWTAVRDAGRYTNDALLPHCFLIERDRSTAHEVRLFGTDAEGNTYESELFTLWGSALLRPTTEASIDELTPAVNVTSWTPVDGSATFTTRPMVDEDDTTCEGGVETTGSSRFVAPDEVPVAEYPTLIGARITIQVGMTLLCADLFDSRGTQIARDTLILRTPSLQRPVITLAGVRLNPGVNVPAAGLSVSPLPSCSHSWESTTEIAGALEGDLAVLWDCGSGGFAVDASGSNTIGVLVGRTDSSGRVREARRGIPIQVDVCDPICPTRPTEWYELPIPTDRGELCGGLDEYGFEGPECTTFDGVAIVRVDYQTVTGTTGAAGATLLGSEAPYVEPVLNIASTVLGATEDWAAIAMTVNVHSDSTVTLRSATLDSLARFGRDGEDPYERGCEGSVRYETATATDFALVLEVCASKAYTLTVSVVDEAGFEFAVHFGLVDGIPSVVADSVDMTVEFIRDSPTETLLYVVDEFLVTLDYEEPGRGWNWSGFEWSSRLSMLPPSCSNLVGGSANNDRDPTVEVFGGGLRVDIMLIADVYESDGEGCPAASRRESLAEEYGSAFVPVSTLMLGGPITVESAHRRRIWIPGHGFVDEPRRPGDVRLEVTITGDWHLELDGVRL